MSFFAEGLYSLQPFCDFCPPKMREGRFCCFQPLCPQSRTLRMLAIPVPSSAIAAANTARACPRPSVRDRRRCAYPRYPSPAAADATRPPHALIGNRGRCAVSTPARPFGCSRRRCAGPAQTARSVPLRPARPRKPRTRYRLGPAPTAARARHRIRIEWYARRQ